MTKIYEKFRIITILAIFCVANLMLNAQSCQWKVQLSGSYGDQISWQLRGAQGNVLLSGGPYTYGFSDEKIITNAGPVEFYIETMGSWTDNVVKYNILNDNGIVRTGTLLGGEEKTISNILCSDQLLPPSNGCLTSSFDPYPSNIYVPFCAGIAETITTSAYAGQYSFVQLTAGKEYKFSSSIATDFITISNEAGTTALTAGTGIVTYNSTTNQVVRFYTHSDNYCNFVNIFRTRSVQCGVASPDAANPN